MRINNISANTNYSKVQNLSQNKTNPSFQRLVLGDKGRKLTVLGGSVVIAVGLSLLSTIGLILSAIPTVAVLIKMAKWANGAPEGANGFIDELPDKKSLNKKNDNNVNLNV